MKRVKQTWKLTPHDVIQIKLMLNKGMKQIAIAKRFGVIRGTVSKIKHGLIWGHIQDGKVNQRSR